MKLVTTTSTIRSYYGDEESIRKIAQAGFDGYDMSLVYWNKNDPIYRDDYLDFAKNIKKVAKESNIPCLQAHAPFAHATSKQMVVDFIPNIKRSIEVCEVIECPIIVVHPHNDFSTKDNYDWYYSEIVPFAEKKGVTIATENMWNRIDSPATHWSKPEYKGITYPSACGTAEAFCEMVDMVSSPNFIACLDIGHAHMENAPTSPVLIRALGDRLKALHVHDNDFIRDAHGLPFSGKIDWDEVIKALRDVGYSGDFTFEVDFGKCPKELAFDTLVRLEKMGRYFIDKITK